MWFKGKLKSNDFERYIAQYSIICLSETKLVESDHVVIPGFNFLQQKSVDTTAKLVYMA